MEKIILKQLLQYYDLSLEPADRIQIVTDGQDWDDADELSVNSDLLKPFSDWTVADMSCEKAFSDERPIIRVSIKERNK